MPDNVADDYEFINAKMKEQKAARAKAQGMAEEPAPSPVKQEQSAQPAGQSGWKKDGQPTDYTTGGC